MVCERESVWCLRWALLAVAADGADRAKGAGGNATDAPGDAHMSTSCLVGRGDACTAAAAWDCVGSCVVRRRCRTRGAIVWYTSP